MGTVGAVAVHKFFSSHCDIYSSSSFVLLLTFLFVTYSFSTLVVEIVVIYNLRCVFGLSCRSTSVHAVLLFINIV